MTVEEEWLVADSAWWGSGVCRGPVALRLRAGAPTDEGPVSIGDVPAGARTRRLPGTVLPGLRDAHVHSALVDLRQVRAGGIAHVHDLGGVPADLSALLAAAADPSSGLPRVRVAGAFLTAPGGYPSDRRWAAPGSWREVRSSEDARTAVAEQREIGASFIKVAVNTVAGPVLPLRTLRSLIGSAHAAGLPVVVHAEGPGTVRVACDAGADRLAHTPWTERLEDGLLRETAQRMTWTSTLDIHGWGQPTPALDTAVDNLRRFLDHGGQVRYGTDLGNGPLPAGVNGREIGRLQAAGLGPDEVLTAMTDLAPLVPGVPPCCIPGGLEHDPATLAGALSTARVVEARSRPNEADGLEPGPGAALHCVPDQEDLT